MSRMPPSFSGGLPCAIAPLAATASPKASPKAETPERTRLMKPPFRHAALFCGLYFDWLDHAACAGQRQAAPLPASLGRLPLAGGGSGGGSEAENFRRIGRRESIFRKAE